MQLRGMIQVESINVGDVHQDRITGITVGLLWDTSVLITYVSYRTRHLSETCYV